MRLIPLGTDSRTVQVAFGIVGFAVLLFAIGAGWTIGRNLYFGIQRGRQHETERRLTSLYDAVEEYRLKTGHLPVAGTGEASALISTLAASGILDAKRAASLSPVDFWGRPIWYVIEPGRVQLWSFGRSGRRLVKEPPPCCRGGVSVDESLILVNGRLVQTSAIID